MSIVSPGRPEGLSSLGSPVEGGPRHESKASSSIIMPREGELSGPHREGASVLSPPTKSAQATKWQQLQTLESLLKSGFITHTEYHDRKSQLVDELTGTRSRTHSSKSSHSMQPEAVAPTVVPRGPPSFDTIESEEATKYIYDLPTRTWRSSKVRVKLDSTPFAKGGLRLVFHLQDLSVKEKAATATTTTTKQQQQQQQQPGGVAPAPRSSYVAKISMDPRDNLDREVYFRDVEMQTLAKHYAKLFNEYRPPKRVNFVKAWILQLDEREGKPLCGVERFIDGPYRKHNNNWGFVSEDERNTPQAFSHFTYECSNHQILICDIQGVSDCYTDPQVHSVDKEGFGKGNLGQRGIDKFLQTHRCNAICRFLKLPSINPNYSGLGTLPMTQYMSYDRVKVVNVYHVPRKVTSIPASQPLLPGTIKEEPTPVCSRCTIL